MGDSNQRVQRYLFHLGLCLFNNGLFALTLRGLQLHWLGIVTLRQLALFQRNANRSKLGAERGA